MISEQEKYERAWAIPQYHDFSPAENMLGLFKQMVRVRKGSLLDIGAGTGRASEKLSKAGWTVTMMDFVQVNPDSLLPFIQANIFEPWPTEKIWDQGFCCDVMEHLPPDKVDPALENIFKHCKRGFFSINFRSDHFGAHVGHPLHLTVKPFMWWVKKLEEYGVVRNARDLLGEGVFDVRQ